MKILKLNALCGLKNQLYCQNQQIDLNNKFEIKDGFFDINSKFWCSILSYDHVTTLINRAKKELQDDLSPKIKAIISNPTVFMQTYHIAIDNLNKIISAKTLFQSLETLEMICLLHTKLFSAPHILTLSRGYIHNCDSAKDLEQICLQHYLNPYLEYINNNVLPQIFEFRPHILILTGKPNLPSFTIAKLVREKCPNVFIIAKEYESDYYSLLKIKKLLYNNSAFFSVYHCVITEDSPNKISEIALWYSKKDCSQLENIKGIIYSLDNGKTIRKNDEENQKTRIPVPDSSSQYVCNIRAFPNNQCYWNSCSFCGINKHIENKCNYWSIENIINKINQLYDLGCNKFWFLDEAIPPNVLKELSTEIVSSNFDMEWHVRTRIEREFTSQSFINLLAKAGLKHILFGFESASDRILNLMKKHTFDFDYLEVAEIIVNMLTSKGIHVHFSVIFGFPNESKIERDETENFLHYLQSTYDLFSYNINIFYLDIGSKIYERWEEYDILSLAYPCAPKYFLGNNIDWIGSINFQSKKLISEEQEACMKKQYSWYPDSTLITPSVFYSFWEFSRYVLHETIVESDNKETINSPQNICLSPFVCKSEISSNTYMIYNLLNHNYIIGGQIINEIYNASINGINYYNFINKYSDVNKSEVENLIVQLAQKEFF